METITGLSLFANVGVAEAYFKELNINMAVANELDEKRAQFYSDIYPNVNMICGDITKDEVFEKIILESKKANVNFVIATPPCQGMSDAGLRLEFDSRNQLIYYAVEAIKALKPKYAIIENVPQILKTKIFYNGQVVLIPEYIKSELGDLYHFNTETLVMAKDYGVPQLRERNIYLLVRNDIPIKWEFPKKQKEVTLFDAIGDLPSLDPYLREGMDFTLEKFPEFEKKRKAGLKISPWHYPPTHSWKQVEWMQHTPSGKSAIYNEVYFPQKTDGTRVKAHHNNYRRLKWDMPCRTITQNNGVISSLACVHPGRPYVDRNGQTLYSDARVLTIYEVLIVMSLPLDWPIPSWANETFIRNVIGEGIPPKLIKEILKELISQL